MNMSLLGCYKQLIAKNDFLVSYLARILSMTDKKSKKAVEAAEAYHYGRSSDAYQLRMNIKAGVCGTDEAICLQFKSLLDLRSIFDSLVYSGRDLKRCKAIYPQLAARHNTINHHHRTTLVAAYKTYIHCL